MKEPREIPQSVQDIGRWLYEFAYRWRLPVAYTAYGLVAAGAYALGYSIRFEFGWPSALTGTFLASAALLLAIRLICVRVFRLSTGRWRFISTRDARRLLAATTTGTLVFVAGTFILPFAPAVPRSVILLEWVLTTFGTASLWVTYRMAYEIVRFQLSDFSGNAKRTLIIGAGESGNLLAREILRYPTGYRLIGFVDDDPFKWGMTIHGIEVIGSTSDLVALAADSRAEELIIAVPSASPSALRRIVESCKGAGLHFKVLPGIAEVLAGDIQVGQLRDVRIEDLLGREPIDLKLPELAAALAGTVVLITGAAGSIGSELSRQVALHQPATLVLFDQAETELFYLERELREKHPQMRLVAVIGDVVDAAALERVFAIHRPFRVYHAAAYKHVPLMEVNPREAVRNNVIGTWRVADASGRHGAGEFVLVSTDKAVKPVSVMGATKRAAELVVLEAQERHPDTVFAAVRFGNVLGSSGSVIPVFRKLLAEGKPLTVTHRDTTRYFMTIPEAVQLILQASILPDVRGRIAMLEMGEPVRILDLARNLLGLSGVRGTAEDHIVFTGLRSGERLHEALTAPHEQTLRTAHPKVRIVTTSAARGVPILPLLGRIETALERGEDGLDILNALLDRGVAEVAAEAAPSGAVGAAVRSEA